MSDVAHEAGVSAQTVSRAIRGAPNVKPETYRAVMAAADRLGYRVNNAARILSSGRSRTLGLVLLQSGGYYSRSAVTAGVESAAEEAGLTVSISTISRLDTGQMERSLSKLADQSVEGLVIAVPLIAVSPKMAEITAAIPTVAIDGSQTEGAAVLGIDQRAAGRIATEYLLGLGHAQVWHVAGPDQWIEARQRREGWEQALTAAGITPPPVLEGDWSPTSGYRQGQILAMIPDVTAIFVAGDEMAFGVIQALRERGRRIPEDVSVIGVDDMELSAFCYPPLTTVRQDFYQIGRDAVLLLLGDVSSRPTAANAEPELVVRDSAAAVAAR